MSNQVPSSPAGVKPRAHEPGAQVAGRHALLGAGRVAAAHRVVGEEGDVGGDRLGADRGEAGLERVVLDPGREERDEEEGDHAPSSPSTLR